MEDFTRLKNVIAKNITEYRKANSMTQLELANALNYTDKAISKWERGESVPDVFVLKQIAEIFEVTLDDLISSKPKKVWRSIARKQVMIPLISAAGVWVVASIIFVCLSLFAAHLEKAWLTYIYAIPATCVVLLTFNYIWGKRKLATVLWSVIVWSVALVIFLSLITVEKIWLIFVVSIPLQAIVVFWYFLKLKVKNK